MTKCPFYVLIDYYALFSPFCSFCKKTNKKVLNICWLFVASLNWKQRIFMHTFSIVPCLGFLKTSEHWNLVLRENIQKAFDLKMFFPHYNIPTNGHFTFLALFCISIDAFGNPRCTHLVPSPRPPLQIFCVLFWPSIMATWTMHSGCVGNLKKLCTFDLTSFIWD